MSQENMKANTAPDQAQNSVFNILNSVDVLPFVEVKNGFSYLPWSIAYRELMARYPDSTVDTVHFDGKPFCAAPVGYMVEVVVTVQNLRRTVMLPVMDENFTTLEKPSAFDINTSIQRCSVKAIAMHGLGFRLYAADGMFNGGGGAATAGAIPVGGTENSPTGQASTGQPSTTQAETGQNAAASNPPQGDQSGADAQDAQNFARLSSRLELTNDTARIRVALSTVKFNSTAYMEKFKGAVRARLVALNVPDVDQFMNQPQPAAPEPAPVASAEPVAQPAAQKAPAEAPAQAVSKPQPAQQSAPAAAQPGGSGIETYW